MIVLRDSTWQSLFGSRTGYAMGLHLLLSVSTRLGVRRSDDSEIRIQQNGCELDNKEGEDLYNGITI